MQDAAEQQTQAVLSAVPVSALCVVQLGSGETEQRAELLCLNAVPALLTLPGRSCERSTGKEGASWLFLTA